MFRSISGIFLKNILKSVQWINFGICLHDLQLGRMLKRELIILITSAHSNYHTIRHIIKSYLISAANGWNIPKGLVETTSLRKGYAGGIIWKQAGIEVLIFHWNELIASKSTRLKLVLFYDGEKKGGWIISIFCLKHYSLLITLLYREYGGCVTDIPTLLKHICTCVSLPLSLLV